MTKKELLEIARNMEAEEVTEENENEIKNHKTIAAAFGTYGTNAKIIKDTNTGKFYKISSRNIYIWKFM